MYFCRFATQNNFKILENPSAVSPRKRTQFFVRKHKIIGQIRSNSTHRACLATIRAFVSYPPGTSTPPLFFSGSIVGIRVVFAVQSIFSHEIDRKTTPKRTFTFSAVLAILPRFCPSQRSAVLFAEDGNNREKLP
jgi:hypothetical protein